MAKRNLVAPRALGSIFKLAPNSHGGWTESLLYSFTGGKYIIAPMGGLVFDNQGNLYGMTAMSVGSGCGGDGCGTVFKLTPSGSGWVQSIIHTFSGPDGELGLNAGFYLGPLVFDPAGNLYGTTPYGGVSGCGTVFELSPSAGGTWTETVIYSFTCGAADLPVGGVVFDQDGDGILYGVASGNPNLGNSVFELVPNSGGGWTETTLYQFPPGVSTAIGPLLLDAARNIYGVTVRANVGESSEVFELTQAVGYWTLNALYTFTDGENLSNPLIFDATGNLYGTTGGSISYLPNGTVFELTPGSGGWTEMTLYLFSSYPDGAFPVGSLLRDTAGNLYGNTIYGGTTGSGGTVFEITP
jgi:uncharacterized repeat protein (TIGR03803 family)